MIYHQSYAAPTTKQLREVRATGSNDFCTSSSEEFAKACPIIHIDGQLLVLDQLPILLKLKNVEPHNDPWVGHGQEPEKRYAAFWLMYGPRMAHSDGWFWCEGSSPVKMRPNDIVVFDDSKLHSFMSESFWYGSAWQLRV